MAKDFMKNNNVAFEEVDVTKDDRAFQDMVQKSGQLGVPVIEVDGTVAVGFNRKILAKILEIPAA
jgi:glutaredoxin